MNAVIENKPGVVDRNKCIVYGVKVLGFSSMNGRIYDPKAIRDAVPLYENAPVNKDHKTEAPLFSDRLGWLQNVRFTSEGLYADFRYNPHADGIDSFLWFAENNGLGDVGFSHLVSGKSIPDQDGTERVVRIDRVRSVDLVANPATTTTIFESKETAMKNDKMMTEENPVKEMYKEEVPDAAPAQEPTASPDSEEPSSDMLKKIMEICVGPGEGSAKGQMILDLIANATGLGGMTAETSDVTGNPTSGTPAQAKVGDTEEDPTEVEAGKYNLNYVKLDGNVGCMVNGAGLAMATMDIIKLSGGEPANFLDVGGTANAETVESGFRIIMSDPNVKAILINIFGGIVRCDRVANGVVEAYRKIGDVQIPIIVRLQGTNAVEAKRIIDESGLKVFSAITLAEAAALVEQVLKA